MEVYVNRKKNQYIFAVNRGGTSFLKSKTVEDLGWKKINYHKTKLRTDKNTQIIKIIRDPYQRWLSWFSSFVLPNNITNWSFEYSTRWINNFKNTLSDDIHTEKQSVLLNSVTIKKGQIKHIFMEDLNLFLEISNQRHYSSYHDNFYRLPENLQKFFYFNIKKIYRDDYHWIKKLPVLVF